MVNSIYYLKFYITKFAEEVFLIYICSTPSISSYFEMYLPVLCDCYGIEFTGNK